MANPLLALRSDLFLPGVGASEAVTYTPPVGASVPDLRAVRSGDFAGSLSGQGNPLRGVSFEIPRSELPSRPRQEGVLLTAEGESWRITQVTDLEHVAAWLLVVEKA